MTLPLRILLFAYWLTLYCVILRKILTEVRGSTKPKVYVLDSAEWVFLIVMPLLAASLGTLLSGIVLSGIFYVFTGYCLPCILGVF